MPVIQFGLNWKEPRYHINGNVQKSQFNPMIKKHERDKRGKRIRTGRIAKTIDRRYWSYVHIWWSPCSAIGESTIKVTQNLNELKSFHAIVTKYADYVKKEHHWQACSNQMEPDRKLGSTEVGTRWKEKWVQDMGFADQRFVFCWTLLQMLVGIYNAASEQTHRWIVQSCWDHAMQFIIKTL